MPPERRCGDPPLGPRVKVLVNATVLTLDPARPRAEAVALSDGRLAGRVRLDHAMFLTPELIGRIKALGIWVVGQPSVVSDLGARRKPVGDGILVMPFRTLREAGVPLAFSSDFSCGTLSPLMGIYAATTRRARSGEENDPAETIPLQATLEAYTINAARAGGLERECGSLEPGKRADLIVLDRNPLEVLPEELPRLQVLRTFIAGPGGVVMILPGGGLRPPSGPPPGLRRQSRRSNSGQEVLP